MMDAFVVKNNAGWYNVIAYNDGWYVWDCDITEGWSAALTALIVGITLVPPPDAIDPEWLAVGVLDLPDHGEPKVFTSEQIVEAEEYAQQYLDD